MTAPFVPDPSSEFARWLRVHYMAVQAGRPDLAAQAMQALQQSRDSANRADVKAAGEVSGMATGLMETGQSATAGFMDELAGGASAVGAMMPGGQSPGDAYTGTRDIVRDAVRAGQTQHPGMALAGEVMGGLLPGAAATKGVGALAQLAGRAVRPGALSGAAIGALGGAARGFGEGESLGGRTALAGGGALAGGIGGGLVGAALGRLGKGMERSFPMRPPGNGGGPLMGPSPGAPPMGPTIPGFLPNAPPMSPSAVPPSSALAALSGASRGAPTPAQLAVRAEAQAAPLPAPGMGRPAAAYDVPPTPPALGPRGGPLVGNKAMQQSGMAADLQANIAKLQGMTDAELQMYSGNPLIRPEIQAAAKLILSTRGGAP